MHLAWTWDLEAEQKELLSHAHAASALILSSLTDASKILDITRKTIEGRLDDEPGREEAHRIIREVMEGFSLYNSPDTLGLLLYLDRNGKLIAQSGEYPTPAYDLSERLYYLDLKENPSKKFALGKLRVAKTTGRRVFHLSMPIREPDGGFAGVIALQLQEKDFNAILSKIVDRNETTILVQLPGGETAFLFPPSQSLSADDQPNGLLARLIEKHGGEEGCFRIPATHSKSDGLSGSTWLAYVRDPIFGLNYSARIPESIILKRYLAKHSHLIAIFLISIAIITALFFALLRKTLGMEKIALDASLDHMTQIRNRRSLEKGLSRLWRDAFRSGSPITVLFMDIDRFKEFNDTHGHLAGDRVLKGAARIIHRSMQRPLDLCGRWGGEEFVVALPETTAREALTVAERIRRRVALMNLKMNGNPLPKTSISIGIASYPDHGSVETLEELIKKADTALRRAKELGRNRVVIYAKEEDVMDAPLLPGIAEQIV